MNIELSVSVSETAVSDRTKLVYELSASAKKFFKNKSYGNDVEEMAIGFLMVFTRPGYENWYKEKKLQYIAHRTKKSRLTGETIEISKRLSYEIKLSDEAIERFINSTEAEAKSFIAAQILHSLVKLNKLPKRIKHFDHAAFSADVKQFFKEQNLVD